MIEILRHRNFRRLFFAQIVALVGTGLARRPCKGTRDFVRGGECRLPV